jgi:hypothetical protein
LTPGSRAFIETNWLEDVRITGELMRLIANETFGEASARTTMDIWRNTLKILYRPRLRIQTLTDQQKNHAYRWAMAKLLAARAAGKPIVVVFSDESRFRPVNDSRWMRYRIGEWNETALNMAMEAHIGWPWPEEGSRGLGLFRDGSRRREIRAEGCLLRFFDKGPATKDVFSGTRRGLPKVSRSRTPYDFYDRRCAPPTPGSRE